MALYIFSDAHLGSNNLQQEQIKLEKIGQLFELIKTDGDHLLILGDLFEFWFEYKNAMPKEHMNILFLLQSLREKGIKIDYVSGNHDFWMDDFFEKQLSISVHRDSFDFKYKNYSIHATHGDGLAKNDTGYRILKKILRNKLNIWLYRKLPVDWAIPLAKAVADHSRKHTSFRTYDSFQQDYENYAKEKLNENYDIVAIGHLHKPILKIFDNGTYINSGDFIKHFSYVKIDTDEISMHHV